MGTRTSLLCLSVKHIQFCYNVVLCWCMIRHPCYRPIAVATLYHSHCSPVWSQQGAYMQSPVPLSLKSLHVGQLLRTLNLWHGTSPIEHFKCSSTKLRRVKWWMDLCKINVIPNSQRISLWSSLICLRLYWCVRFSYFVGSYLWFVSSTLIAFYRRYDL